MWSSKKSTNQVKSAFFHGISIGEKISNGFIGYFIRIIKDYNNSIKPCTKTNGIVSDLHFPKVIVIGAESSGKSSLLENITKCPIFPRNITICTRLPIHFKLNVNQDKSFICQITYQNITTSIDKDLIQDRIQEIMNTLETEISFDEIVIELNDDSLPMFEFYDLPGIVAYPTTLSEQTYKLCEKYVCQKDVIILCVIPATTPRITSYQPIGLIKKYKKEKETIICLTMSDRVQEDNIEDLIVKRITRTTNEYDANEFAGSCAIMNRSHKDNIQLLENDTVENTWFKINIIDNIPNDYHKDLKDLIKNNITIINLINNLHVIYNNYIKTVWIPNTLIRLNSDKNYINIEIKLLGVEVKSINKKKLEAFYKHYTLDYFIPKYKEILYDKYKNKEDICKYSDNNICDEDDEVKVNDEIDDDDEVDNDDDDDDEAVENNDKDGKEADVNTNAKSNVKSGVKSGVKSDDEDNDKDDKEVVDVKTNAESDDEDDNDKEFVDVKSDTKSNDKDINYNIKTLDNYIFVQLIKYEECTIFNYISNHIIAYEKLTLKFNIKRFNILTTEYINTLCTFINSKINICLTSVESTIKWKFLTNDSKLIKSILIIITDCIDKYVISFFSGKNFEKIKFNKILEFINLRENDKFLTKRTELKFKLDEVEKLICNITKNNFYETELT